MIQLLFVGDGQRDTVMVPALVQKVLGVSVGEESRQWARLQGAGRGYAKKLKFAVRTAIDRGLEGVVAVVDQDREKRGVRCIQMQAARDEDRAKAVLMPTAVGEACPHGEAWLLDDPSAVRIALKLSKDHPITSVKKTNSPKRELHRLISDSERAGDKPLHVLGDIAEYVDTSRYQQPEGTGWTAFEVEIQSELRPLVHL